MPEVLIALGSNVGDRLAHLVEAVGRLGKVVDLWGASRVYETAPMYVEDQPAFLNAAVLGSARLPPMALLGQLKRIEAEVGRLPRTRNGPREIDLDLISYGAVEYRFWNSEDVVLRLPHPRAPERRFVLQPAADLAPELDLPPFGKVRDLLRLTEDQAGSVRPLPGACLPI